MMPFVFLILAGASISAQQYLQPTSKDILRTVAAIRSDSRCPVNIQFISVGPADPPKTQQTAPPDYVPAQIQSVIRDRQSKLVYEIFSECASGKVTEWRRIDGVQPMLSDDDYDSAAAIVRRHEAWNKALKRRGLTPNDVFIDTWASGIPMSTMPYRIVRALTYARSTSKTNLYDRPIEGLVCVVNIDANRVIEFHDRELAPIPPPLADFNANYTKAELSQAPFRIQQNAKKAVNINGSKIRWGNWEFNALLHAREGLVIHNALINDGPRKRKVAHRLSLSEMVVPYGDTSQHWWWRAAFDVGEYGVGNLTTPLQPGTDLPANAQTMHACFARNDGTPMEIPHAIGVYERDGGIIWKHSDPFTGENRVRRARELVVTSITTVGNYDYGLSYVFCIDGTIKVEVGLTGILLPKAVPDTVVNENSPYGQMYGALVSPNIIAPNHQHFFCFRLDLDVDGEKNTVSEMDLWSPPKEENPRGSAIAMDDYEWYYEREAHSDVHLKAARKWKVSSATTKNVLGGKPAYCIVPSGNAVPFLNPQHILWTRAPFLKHHLWATRFHDNEMYAAGDFPSQNITEQGVTVYQSNNEKLRGQDIVLWYTVGISHHPRPEEWPIMNVHQVGFKLEPMGFFNANPAQFLKP